MTLLYRFITFILFILPLQIQAAGEYQLYSTYPSTPPSYANLDAGALISDARVDFGMSSQVEKTDGYQVISPDGDIFYVDNIEKPKCAFYATYVNRNDDEMGQSANIEILSNVYIEEVNFENC